MTMTTLTDKEQIAFTAIVVEGLSNVCGKHPSDLLEDNCSWFTPQNIEIRTDYSKHQVAGFISSLEKKGLICNSGDGEGFRAEWFISETGLNHQIEFLGDTVKVAVEETVESPIDEDVSIDIKIELPITVSAYKNKAIGKWWGTATFNGEVIYRFGVAKKTRFPTCDTRQEAVNGVVAFLNVK